jgi:hypothetical protein
VTLASLSALEHLASGSRFRFADWPVREVPESPGLYTIWDADDFLYVGMAGRGIATRSLLRGRFTSHASGRRSGDQFCLYVCDRLIVPHLTADQLRGVGDGRLSLDAMTDRYVRERLLFRFVTAVDGQAALLLERDIKRRGLLTFGKPLLNPHTL